MKEKIEGVITKYKGNGRKLGYPTANLNVDTELADGVYFGYAELDGYTHHPALIFIGTPTTVGDTERRVEAHLLDAIDKDYYDMPLQLEVHKFHRSNKNFDSIDDLLIVMKADDQTAREWFKTQK